MKSKMYNHNLNMPELSIIVISYNTCEMTLECLRSVYRETKTTGFELIVLDNASSDGSSEAIDAEFGNEIKLISSKDNLGFAAGNNKVAQEANGKFLLLLNPDTVVLDGAIDKLIVFAHKNSEAKIWGGKTLFADMSLNPTSCWRQITLWNLFCRAFSFTRLFKNSSLFNSEQYGGWKRDTVKHVDIVTGCFLLIKTTLWKEIGGFDPGFFMYGEDADLCLQAINHGAKPIINPDSVIIHYGGASERVKEDKIIKLLKAKHLLIKKHWGVFKYEFGKFIILLYPLNKMITHKILSLIDHKHKLESLVWNAIWKRRKEWLEI